MVMNSTHASLRSEPKLLTLSKLLSLLGIAVFSLLIISRPMVATSVVYGVPLLAVALLNRSRFSVWLFLVAAAPLVGIVKGLTQSRYAPFMLDILLIFLVGSGVAYWLTHRTLQTKWMDALIVLYLVICLFQIFNPNVPTLVAGLEGFRAIAFQTLGFFAGAFYLTSSSRIRRYMIVLTVVAIFTALYGIKQFFYPSWVDNNIISLTGAAVITYTSKGQMRAFSTLPGPFHFGIFMVFAVLLMQCFRNHLKVKLLYLFGIPVCLIALLLSITRGNWLALAGGLLAYTVLRALETRRFLLTLLKILIGVSLIVIFCLSTYLLVQQIQDLPGFKVIFERLTSLTMMFEDEHYLGRVEGWQREVMPALRRNPWGYGLASALDSFSHRPDFIGHYFFTSHNQYLKVALELGLFGILVFIFIMIGGLVIAFRNFRLVSEPILKSTAVLFMAMWVAVNISSMASPILDAYPINLYFWALMGVVTRLPLIEKRDFLSS
jgi:O-antigen ligase